MVLIINSQIYNIIEEIRSKYQNSIKYKLVKNNKYFTLQKFKIHNEEDLVYYKNKAEIMSEFNHENIIQYFYSYVQDNYFCILTEYEGEYNLRQIIKKQQDSNELIQEKKIVNIIQQICKGLKEIQKNKVIHINLSPDNIFINENNIVKIGGFDNAIRINDNILKEIFSPIAYTAPEILHKKTFDSRAIVYSFGCIIYELFTLHSNDISGMKEKIKKINLDIYSQKWQELIDLALNDDYLKRPTIDEIYNKYFKNELIHEDSSQFNVRNNNQKEKNYPNLPIKINLEEFHDRYQILEKIFSDFGYTFYSATKKGERNHVIIKQYDEEFTKKYFDYINTELSALCKVKNKFIIKLKEYVLSGQKAIFVFDYFQINKIFMRNERRDEKQTIFIIYKFLVQIYKIINELDKYGIDDIIISSDNICIDENDNFKLINLFPYSKFIKENKSSLKNESLKNISVKVNYSDFSKTNLLWNIGFLLYEICFEEIPYEFFFDNNNNYKIKLKKLKKLNLEFDDLLINLLEIKKSKFSLYDFTNYIKSFLIENRYLSGKEKCKILCSKEINKFDNGIDLKYNDVSENNLQFLSEIKINLLFWLDISNNDYKDINYLKDFSDLKILIAENNNIQKMSCLSYLKKLEYLFLGSNPLTNFEFFAGNKLLSLTCLSLNNNKINDLSSLKNSLFPNIETLNLSNNLIKDISFICKAKFKYLTNLYLNNNKIENISLLGELSPCLKILDLNNNSISDINVLSEVLFANNIKELYLDNNPIYKYEKLNFSYFSSVKKLIIPSKCKNDHNLLLVSIKMKLHGYELLDEEPKENKIIINCKNFDEKISILLIPDKYSNDIYKDMNKLNNSNSFKIIANSDITKKELKEFFCNEILGIQNKKFYDKSINIFSKIENETKNEESMKYNNYTFFCYNDFSHIIKESMKSNVIYLSDKYRESHELSDNYNKIPGYLESKDRYLVCDHCKLSKAKSSYFGSIPCKFIDEKYELSEIMEKSDYIQKLPLIFIVKHYYKDFIEFLEYYDKYKKFQKYNCIFVKYFLIPYDKNDIKSNKKYCFLHSDYNEIFAEVFENINYIYYSLSEVNSIISLLKFEHINYIKMINTWIINIFDIMSDYILFVLKRVADYMVCPYCKNPLLFIYDDNKRNKVLSNDLINIMPIISEDDPFLDKSLKIVNKFIDIDCNNIDESLLYENRQKHEKIDKSLKLCNPPKSNNFINVIYYNDNEFDSIKDEVNEFYNQTNGFFIFSNSIESFKDIITYIKNNNTNKCNFYLISNGRSFVQVWNQVENIGIKNFIKKACIFCFEKQNYLNYLNDYQILKGIYTSKEEIIQFIDNNSLSRTIPYESSKMVTYDKYTKKLYKMHQLISKYYRENSNSSFTIFYRRLEEEIKNSSENAKNEYRKIFNKFQSNTDSENAIDLIYDYTGNYLYGKINSWLLDIENWSFDKKSENSIQKIKNFFLSLFGKRKKYDLFYEKNAYFVGQLMYKVNFRIIEQKNLRQMENRELTASTYFRGLATNCMDALIYQTQVGKIISFATFLSTSKNEEKAEEFAERRLTEAKNYKIILKINVNRNKNFFPLFYKITKSQYPGEQERLFNPFTFFKLTNLTCTGRTIEVYLEAIRKREILELDLNEKNNLIYDKENNIITFENGQYYIGDWSNGHKNGSGRIYYKNNTIKYEGNFVHDKFEGEGRFNWDNGEYYVGEFKNGLRNGRGKQYYKNNTIKYEGNFLNDKYDGTGTYFAENGEYYIGNWLNGKRHGYGTQYYSNKKPKYIGNYVNGKYDGEGRYIFKDGEYFIGNWKNGLRHGKGTEYDRNNKIIYEGNFDDKYYKDSHCFIY